MSLIKSAKEIEIMRHSGKILGQVHSELIKMVQPGITTKELDDYAEKRIREMDAIPSFKGFHGFPATLCTAVNDEVVHTFPSDYKLKKGDLISIDCGVNYNGFHSDSAVTVAVGDPSPKVQKFMDIAEQALKAGINAAKAGNRVNDISRAIQETIEPAGYSIIKELTGHGVGRNIHEEPHVPNHVEPRKTIELQPGMTLAIEPIFSMGKADIYTANDGWNIKTKDQSLAIQVEHTILITDKEAEILTKRP